MERLDIKDNGQLALDQKPARLSIHEKIEDHTEMELTRWHQRRKLQWFKEGDDNKKFFH